MSETRSSEGLHAPKLLSLPEDLLINIASMLEDQDVYHMEFTSRKMYTALTTSCRAWPTERQLDLGARFGASVPSPEALRSSNSLDASWISRSVVFLTSPLPSPIRTNIEGVFFLQVASEKGQEIHAHHLRLLRGDSA